MRKDISSLVKVRGEIVHRGSTPGALNLSGVRGWADFVRRLVEKFDEHMVEFHSGLTSGGKR
ncbi:HEPN domain-containing protein [Corynebacterium sanguinis]|uniref:HEPN domain-containing protein n=1 Tax=Corynebacterium sanguinis TaxID=2594913 RepID=UPI0035CD1CFD